MNQREREFKPRDSRAKTGRIEKPTRLRDGGMADEFETLFSMRDQAAPELKGDDERAIEQGATAIEKATDKGFER